MTPHTFGKESNHPRAVGNETTSFVGNVNPGLISLWLINRGVSPFSGDSDHFWREHPP